MRCSSTSSHRLRSVPSWGLWHPQGPWWRSHQRCHHCVMTRWQSHICQQTRRWRVWSHDHRNPQGERRSHQRHHLRLGRTHHADLYDLMRWWGAWVHVLLEPQRQHAPLARRTQPQTHQTCMHLHHLKSSTSQACKSVRLSTGFVGWIQT